MLKDYQKNILGLLEELEMTMSNLYKLFADKYPQYKDDWNVMATEEIEHAEIINKFLTAIEEDKIIFEEKMIKTNALQLFINSIKKLYTDVETNKITLSKALILSNDFEQSIIEKKFYSYFISNDPDLKNLISSVIQDTNGHALRIKKILDGEKKR